MIRYSILAGILFLGCACQKPQLITSSEKDWLTRHPNLVVGISANSPPYEFVNEKGEIRGIFMDFLSLIEKRLDYKFKRVYQSDFPKLLIELRNGTIDVEIDIQKTEERLKYLNFTPFLISHPHAIVVRKSEQNISGIEDLNGKNVAVVNKYALQEYLSKKYPLVKLLPLPDDVSCLRLVSSGQADAFACQQAVATYFIEAEGFSNLKIAGEIHYKNELAIASRKDLDTLNIILTKAVNSISKAEKAEIYENWLSYTVKPFYQQVRFLVTVLIGIMFILSMIVLFVIALRKSVKLKTKELKIALEHAEESDRLKSAFLANMSHEIRTPMNGILGFAELLKTPGLTGEQQQEYIDIIKKSSDRMLNIISDIVDISKIESGQVKIVLCETNLNEQLDFIFNLSAEVCKNKGLELICKKGLPLQDAFIKTDQEKIKVILSNLVKNAIKYTDNGTIEFGYKIATVETLHVETLHATSLTVQFYVKDTGIGIPKDRQQAIFERFVQADIADTRAFQGAGLGLSISKAYVEMLGGKIWVESEEGNGSVFYFTIPGYSMPEDKIKVDTTAKQPMTLNRAANLKILIAEDDEASEMLLAILVKKYSREILKSRTGPEAIEICRLHPDTDLILMDIQMPELNGYEVTRQIRQFNRDVVIIAQTAFGLSGDREKAIEAGCDDYIAKPLNEIVLNELMQKYFADKKSR